MAKSRSTRGKHYHPKRISRYQANKLIYATIFRASTEEISEQQRMALILGARQRIKHGANTDGGRNALHQANVLER